MANFNDIDAARKLLGLNELATLAQINHAYKNMARFNHPDKQAGNGTETMAKINRAYEILTDYTGKYVFSFTEDNVARVYPAEEHMRKYYDHADWM